MDQPVTPDWSVLPDEVFCPFCCYNLRGLAEPRCPECGYSFDWPDVLDPNRFLHPYLFEHHSRRNVWSFFRTLLGGLRPRKFWSTLQPAHSAVASRLTLYHLLVVALTLGPALTRLTNKGLLTENFGYWHNWDGDRLGDVLDSFLPALDESPLTHWLLKSVRRVDAGQALWCLPLLTLILPYAVLLPLGVFQWSMHSARVGYEHVRRCVIYSADVAAWFALLLVALIAVLSYNDYRNGMLLPGRDVSAVFATAVFATLPAVWMLMMLRLASACKRYLRFKYAGAVVISANVILLLFLLLLALGIRSALPIQ